MSANQNGVTLSQLVSIIPVRRKLIEQDDRDKFEWNQWQSATKAMNNVESPVKEKHIRNLIFGTIRLEGSRLFWSMVIRIHVESHPIVCWKFCYVIHRLLRDGHRYVVSDAILLSAYFNQLCKYWSGSQQNYGLLTYRYCHLIVLKLKFHERNSQFNGNLTTSDEKNSIQNFFHENWNLYSQLCVELLDYLEEVLNLVQIVFTSLDQSRSNSMTTTGQCRLNPLIICIQDSSLLYDCIVKVLFKLHESQPNETFQTHQQRLIDQFRRLKRFYGQSSTLQYFKNLVKVPILAENPPNFNTKEDLKNYRTALAIVHSSPVADDFLINLSDNVSTMVNDDPSGNETIHNRSKEISDLEQRLMQYDTMLKQNRSETDDLHRTIAAKDAELITERNNRLQIEEQLRQQLMNRKHLEDMHTIEKQTNSEEKFNQLREEHLAVLRQDGERQKQLMDLNQQILQLKKKENEFQENSEKFNAKILQLHQTNDELQARIQVLTTERDDYQTLTQRTNELIKEIEHEKQNVEERYQELENDKTRLAHDKSIAEKQLKATEGVRRNLTDQNREHEEDLLDLIHENELLEQRILDLEQTTREWAQKFIDTTDKQKLIQINHENLFNHLKRQYKYSILSYCIQQIHEAIDRKKDMQSFEYLLFKLQIAVASARKIQDLSNQSDETMNLPLLNECITLANCMTDIVVCGKTTLNLADDCRDLANHCLDLYTNFQTNTSICEKQSIELIERCNLLIQKTQTSLHNSH